MKDLYRPKKCILFDSVEQRDRVNAVFPWGTFNRFILKLLDDIVSLGEKDSKLIAEALYKSKISVKLLMERKDKDGTE